MNIRTDTTLSRRLSALLCALFSSVAVWAHLGLHSREPLLLAAAAGFYFVFIRAAECRDKRIKRAALICGVLFALFTVLGNLDALSEKLSYRFWTLMRFVGFSLFYRAALVLLFDRLCSLELLAADEARDLSLRARLKVFFMAFVPLCLCFFIWWLYEYPGNTSPDSNHQLMQCLGLIPLSSNHPALSTLVMGIFFNTGMKLFSGDQNAALALYTAFQVIFMAAVFAFAVESAYEARFKKWVVALPGLVYLLVPHHGSYSVTVWKDVLFAGWGLLFCTCLWRLIRAAGKEEASFPLWDTVLLYLSGLCLGLYRNMAHMVFILLIPFMFFIFRRKNRAAAVMPILVFAASAFIYGPLYNSLDIAHGDLIESFSVPAQHIARVIKDGHPLTDEQYELLSHAVDVEQVAETYNSGISDPIKALVRKTGDQQYISEHSGEYLRLWLELGTEYPGAYLRAQIDQTKGYWYPDVDYWSMSNYCEESDTLTIFKDRKLPDGMCTALTGLYFYLPSLPFAGLIYSMGTATWCLIALFALCILRGGKKELVIFLPVLVLVLGVCVVTPVFAEYRYVYPMFTALPLLGLLPFSQVNCHKDKELPR